MFDGKFIATLVALVVAVLAICNYNTNKITSREEFGMLPSRVWKVDGALADSREAAAKGDFYSVPGYYQSMMSPRFLNADLGANIRYNTPSLENMAVPAQPLDFGLMVNKGYNRENFTTNATTEGYGCGNCSASVGCRAGGAPIDMHAAPPLMAADFASGNYNELTQQSRDNLYPETSDMIPVGDMTTLNAEGETIQPIVYERFIYANRNSRLRSLGDPIRGDLAIVPCKADWFRPSVHPVIDLQEGAMNVMGGVSNETTQELATLIAATSGDRIIAGVDLSQVVHDPTMTTLKSSEWSSAMADVNVTAFP